MSLEEFFNPKSVAVIGASRDGGKIGHSILRNFLESHYSGEIFPVNPNADEVMGYRSYDSVLDIGRDVDLAVVSVPASIANDSIEECVEKEVKAVIVVSSGYREVGEEGEKRSEELKDILEGSSTRLMGPNCLGVWDSYTGVDTLFLPSYKLKRPPQGNIAIISQSGSFGSTVMDLLADMGVGVSRFVSYGNQIDVNEVELVEWFKYDDTTEALAIYMEGVSEGRDFLEKVQEVTVDMPVIVLKGGKRASGIHAANSHTGSLAGSYEVYRGVFRQAGALEATEINEFYDFSRALAYNDPLEGRNVCVVTNGGGFGVLAADALEKEGLRVPPFSGGTEDLLEDVVPEYGNVTNPLDLVGDADAERYEEALEILGEDDSIDGIIVIPLLQPLPLESDVVDTIVNFEESFDGPFLVAMTGGDYTEIHMENLEKNNIAAYSSPERAARAMKALYRYGEERY